MSYVTRLMLANEYTITMPSGTMKNSSIQASVGNASSARARGRFRTVISPRSRGLELVPYLGVGRRCLAEIVLELDVGEGGGVDDQRRVILDVGLDEIG